MADRWTKDDSEKTKNFLIQMVHIGALTESQKNELIRLITKAVDILDEQNAQTNR